MEDVVTLTPTTSDLPELGRSTKKIRETSEVRTNYISCLFDTIEFSYAGYHWDCSDWARHSQTLPNITEVPSSEIPDSSSFHSNESNESRCANHVPHSYHNHKLPGGVSPLNEVSLKKKQNYYYFLIVEVKLIDIFDMRPN